MRWWWVPLCSNYKPKTLSWIFIVLAHWNNSPRIDMSLHSDTLFWFRAIQSLLLLLNDACLAETQHIPILYSLVWPDRGLNPQYIALDASTLTIMLPMRFPIFILFYLFFNQNFLVSFNILFENKINPKQ